MGPGKVGDHRFRVMWGFPRAWAVPGDWLDWALTFHGMSRHNFSMPRPAGHAGRIDIARSYLIQTAKRNRWADWLWTWDTDVFMHDVPCQNGCDHPILRADRVLEILEEDREVGLDVIHAPVMNTHGNLSFGLDSEVQRLGVRHDRAFEVAWTTGAFLAFSRKAIDALRPNGSITNQDGSTVALYCRMLENVTEDADLGANIRKCGLRIGVDPRLLAAHGKTWRMFIEPKFWESEERAVRGG